MSDITSSSMSYIDPDLKIWANENKEAQRVSDLKVQNQEASQESFQGDLVKGFLRLYRDQQTTNNKPLKSMGKRVGRAGQLGEKEGGAVTKILKESTAQVADRFNKKNPELNKDALLKLRDHLSPQDNAQTIMDKVKKMYPDPFLMDEALSFLEDTTDGQLQQEVVEARKNLNEDAIEGRAVVAGRNMTEQAREFSEKGLGSPTALRKLYTNLITNLPKSASDHVKDFSSQFSYEKMRVVVQFLLHSMGSELRKGGPDIDAGKLFRLMTEVRTMQAVVGVYRFFKARMGLVNRQFSSLALTKPAGLTFENMAEAFVSLASERGLSPEKVRLLAARFGFSKNELAGSIIALSQLRDAINEVDGSRFFARASNDQIAVITHRQELWNAVIACLEQLEDEYEEITNQLADFVTSNEFNPDVAPKSEQELDEEDLKINLDAEEEPGNIPVYIEVGEHILQTIRKLGKNLDYLEFAANRARNTMIEEFGFKLPEIFIRKAGPSVARNEYVFAYNGIIIIRAKVLEGYFLVYAKEDSIKKMSLPYKIYKNTLGLPSVWIEERYEEVLKKSQTKFIRTHEVLGYHLSLFFKNYAMSYYEKMGEL